jgi:hypothetical protein
MADADEYTFHGDGIHATYFPEGSGPLTQQGAVVFSYQDTHLSKTFNKAETVVTQVDGVASLVTVVLNRNDISHAQTSFTVLIPSVGVERGSPQSFKTKGITTVEGATLVQRTVFPALQTYKVEQLDGTASLSAIAE